MSKTRNLYALLILLFSLAAWLVISIFDSSENAQPEYSNKPDSAPTSAINTKPEPAPKSETEQKQPPEESGDQQTTTSHSQAINSNDKTIKDNPKIPYEGDWCIPSTDLSAEDLALYHIEKQELDKDRGRIYLEPNNQKTLASQTSDYLPPDYLSPYREMDLYDLTALGQQNDKLALSTLIQRPDVDYNDQTQLAKQALALGDTSIALSHLTTHEIILAKFAFAENNQKINDRVKKHLINALAYVKIGLSRKDTYALNSFATTTARKQQHGGYFDPGKVLSSDELAQTDEIQAQILKDIEAQREANNLPSFQSSEISTLAQKTFNSEIAAIYQTYGEEFYSGNIMQHLNQGYPLQNHCTEKLLKTAD